jgi:hypothetical protein
MTFPPMPDNERRIVQVSVAATNHIIDKGHNWIVAALCNDGTVFITSAANPWIRLPSIPQPEPLPEKD